MRSSGNRPHQSTTSRSWVTAAAHRCPSGQGATERTGRRPATARAARRSSTPSRDTTGVRLRPALTRGFSAAGTRPCRSVAVERCSIAPPATSATLRSAAVVTRTSPSLRSKAAWELKSAATDPADSRSTTVRCTRSHSACSATSRRDRSISRSSPKRSAGRSWLRSTSTRITATPLREPVRGWCERGVPPPRGGAAHRPPRRCWHPRRHRGRYAPRAERRTPAPSQASSSMTMVPCETGAKPRIREWLGWEEVTRVTRGAMLTRSPMVIFPRSASSSTMSRSSAMYTSLPMLKPQESKQGHPPTRKECVPGPPLENLLSEAPREAHELIPGSGRGPRPTEPPGRVTGTRPRPLRPGGRDRARRGSARRVLASNHRPAVGPVHPSVA